MFKKLKERIESEDGNNISFEKGPSPVKQIIPGVVVRQQQTPSLSEEERDIDIEEKDSLSQPVITGEKEKESQVIVDSSKLGEEEEKEDESPSKKNNRAVIRQLTSELVTIRRQYNHLITDKEQTDRDNTTLIQSLQSSLTEKEEMVSKLEKRVTELSWSVDSLTSRLQMYSNYEKEDIIKKLQSQVAELESRLRQRDLDIEIYETRVAAQSKQRHDEQMSYKKKTHGLEDTMTTLQASVQEKDQRLTHLNSEVIKIRNSLGEVEKRRKELEEMIEQQKRNLNKKDQQLEEQVSSHSEELERMKVQHSQIINELHEQIKLIKEELKDKEAKLERLLTQLPNEPVVNTVLDGYSKTNMASNFEVSLPRTPGGVYRKEVDPLSRPDPNEPPVLPFEEATPTNNDTINEFNPHYEVQLLESKRYNEMLEEELEEKNKTIRLQQQKLTDMKKALMNKEKETAPLPPPLPPSLTPPTTDVQLPIETASDKRFVISSDVNFQYLKNVIIRFICTREDEALQLVRAVSTLLELNNAEEKYVRDYLTYKLSWFGTMPAPPESSKIIKTIK